MRNNLLHCNRAVDQVDLNLLDLRGLFDLKSKIIKNILRGVGKTPAFVKNCQDFPGNVSVNSSVKILGDKVSFDHHFDVNRNFVNHKLKVGEVCFSAFLKGLVRGLKDIPKLAHIHLGNI